MTNKLHFNMMMMVVLAFCLMASFCKKTETGVLTAEAKIYNSGPVATDGCGWFLRIDSTKEYSPVALDEDFKVGEGMKVTVSYRLLNTRYTCGWGSKLQQIEIVSIKRKDPIPLPTEATVLNTGTAGGDGCGWLIKVDNTLYSPINLPEKYKQDNMKVKMAFTIMPDSKYTCGISGNLQYDRITIKDIQAK